MRITFNIQIKEIHSWCIRESNQLAHFYEFLPLKWQLNVNFYLPKCDLVLDFQDTFFTLVTEFLYFKVQTLLEYFNPLISL